MSETEQPDLARLTVELLSAYVANNAVDSEALPALIESTRAALAGEAATKAEAAAQYKPAVSIEQSLASPDHILSMIDGKPYKALKRHLSNNGVTPEEYRARYNLPADYPLVSPNYSEQRRNFAKASGLGGRSPVAASGAKASKPAAAPKAATTSKRAATPKAAATPEASVAPKAAAVATKSAAKAVSTKAADKPAAKAAKAVPGKKAAAKVTSKPAAQPGAGNSAVETAPSKIGAEKTATPASAGGNAAKPAKAPARRTARAKSPQPATAHSGAITTPAPTSNARKTLGIRAPSAESDASSSAAPKPAPAPAKTTSPKTAAKKVTAKLATTKTGSTVNSSTAKPNKAAAPVKPASEAETIAAAPATNEKVSN